MAHTPGPWTVVQTMTTEVESVIASPFTVRAALGSVPHGLMADYRGEIVAEIQQNGSDPVDGMAEANARLIAAAPDLLAALKAITDGAYGNPGYPQVNRNIERMAEAAIAKAEGRA